MFNLTSVETRKQKALDRAAKETLVPCRHYQTTSIFQSDDLVFGKLGVENMPVILTLLVGTEAVMIINSEFRKAPLHIQNGLIGSEYAHTILGHHNPLACIGKSRLEVESAADEYAQETLGEDVISGLKFLLEKRVDLPLVTREFLDARINILQQFKTSKSIH